MNAPDEIHNWNDISDQGWSGILLGNGASIAIWDNFGYASIFERARQGIENPLSPQDIELFEQFQTRNFEVTLSSLTTSLRVNRALGLQDAEVLARYQSIRRALVQAVRSVHIPWVAFDEDRRHLVRNALLDYDYVYSTNYDLLVYWAIMARPRGEGFKDYFWTEEFNIGDTEITDKVTKVLYLHGGIHLYRTSSGTRGHWLFSDTLYQKLATNT